MATLKTLLHSKMDKNKNKRYRLAIRLTVNRKRSYYYLSKEINPKYWDSQGEQFLMISTTYSFFTFI
ncbi:Arm DNA-binding domain-containing protein [Flavivirga abyssicola]|uniref:Arm DNA-binding domain-containing protein n=1 Tax=Flavivirga abyssicola TaxID=3063533 RepID=UPI0026DED13E|nr:Arm DNA-binding domain-containing protein [Flavivirga sp. MEBiC07777]